MCFNSKARFDLRNLESVFSAFEMASLFKRLHNLPDESVRKLPAAIGRVIVRTIQWGMKRGRAASRRLWPCFPALAEASPPTVVRVRAHASGIYSLTIEMRLSLQCDTYTLLLAGSTTA
jgi:lauroyl/myristoyl acyltransferase